MLFKINMPEESDENSQCTCGNCQASEKPLEQPTQARCLNDALASFLSPCTKKVGQLLKFKQGIGNAYAFHPDTLFVVAEVFDPPLDGRGDLGSVHYGRKLDLAVLAFDIELGTIWICADSRFFEDYTGEVE